MTAELVPYREPVSSLELAPQAWKLAEKIAGTDFVPTALRGKPEAVLACILAGHEAGISPMQALSKIHIIEGRPAMAAELMRALVLRQGHELEYSEVSTTSVTAEGRRRGSERWTRVTWTMDDAKRGNLDGKTNWKRWPRAMLIARATSELCRMIFADVLAGISYTIEELEDSGDAPSGLVDFGPAEIVDTTSTPAAPARNTARTRAITRQAAPPAPDEPPERPAGEVPDLPADGIIEAEVVSDSARLDEPPEIGTEPADAARNTARPATPAAAARAPSAAAAEEEDDWPSGDFPTEPTPADGRRYTGPQIIAIKLAERYGIKGNSAEARAQRLERISEILGRTIESSRDLTPEEIEAVIAAINAPAEAQNEQDPAATSSEPSPPTSELPSHPETAQATTAPPRTTRSTPSPTPEAWTGDQWRELLTARKVKVTETMREAQRLGSLLDPPHAVGTLDDVAGSKIAVDLLGWIEDLSLERKAKS